MSGQGGATAASGLPSATAPVSARGPPRVDARHTQVDSSKSGYLKRSTEIYGGSAAFSKHTGPPARMPMRRPEAGGLRPRPLQQMTAGGAGEEHGTKAIKN